MSKEETMNGLQAIAGRVEIEALRGEFTDAVMMRDDDRVASLFTADGALRMPSIPVELEGRQEIRAWGERVPALVERVYEVRYHDTSPLAGWAPRAAGGSANPPGTGTASPRERDWQ
jgi:hypothetical protein